MNLGSIGPYTVGRWLARGGSADVYEASHLLIARPLAIKVAHRHDSQHGGSRFARELQILTQLDHPAFAGRIVAAAPQTGSGGRGEGSVLGGLGRMLDGDNN